MTETLQTAELPRQGVPKQTAAAALTALGVVYGDIGTSTLYGLKQAVDAAGEPCACRKLNPGILVMQSTQDWATKNVPGSIDGAGDRCIFLQR
jgi:hypothetical protein